jgi:hypothetical protein
MTLTPLRHGAPCNSLTDCVGALIWEGNAVQDFRTRLVCPECGEEGNSDLQRPAWARCLSVLDESVFRRCRDCEHVWWVDWSRRPSVVFN